MKKAALTVIALFIVAGCSQTETNITSESNTENQQKIEQAKKIRENNRKSRMNDYKNPQKFNVLTESEKKKLETKLILQKNAQLKSKTKGPEIIVQ